MIDKHLYEQIFRKVEPESFLYEFLNSGDPLYHLAVPRQSQAEERIKDLHGMYLLFTNWVQGPYQEIQAQGFSYSPSLRGLFGKPRACIFWYGTSTQLVNSLLHDPFLESE